jgi:tripartite-type tricarboxylate transporter receptor subunit TctC
MKSTTLSILASFCLSLSAIHAGNAGSYPDRPIHVVVAYAPGGGTDIAARLLGEQLSTVLNQPIVIDNRPGASGMIGASYVARSLADGYTLFVATQTTQAVDPPVYASTINYNAETDFTPISQIADTPMMLVVNTTFPVNSVAEFISYARARPGQLTYATVGNGSTPHMAGELFKKMAHLDVLAVPFRGEGPAIQEVLGGRITYMFCDIPVGTPFVKSGRLKVLGVTSAKRSSVAPDLPSIAESGLPSYDMVTWFGLFGPANLPKDVVGKLNAAVQAVAKLPALNEKFAKLGYVLRADSPESFNAFVEAEQKKWADVVKEANLKVQ